MMQFSLIFAHLCICHLCIHLQHLEFSTLLSLPLDVTGNSLKLIQSFRSSTLVHLQWAKMKDELAIFRKTKLDFLI